MGSADDDLDDWSLSTLEVSSGDAAAFAFAIATGLTTGKELGKFRLVRPLGEGAYAEVWLAMEQGELGFQKQVALKILKETATDKAALDSLINEARVCGMLHHPHIVDVYGVTQVESFTFIAMEYVDGTTLEHLMDRVRAGGFHLPLAVIVDVAIGIAKALDHAHGAKGPDGLPLEVVHRDLKPGNVMLAPRVGVKVTDFGLAKATSNRNVTQAGQVRGTPGYIAPEVWAGTRDFTPGVDLWALGVMIWEMVVGEHMFEGTIMEVMGQCMNGDLDAEIGRLAAVRPRLAKITRTLLDRDPAARCQSAWETVVALEQLRSKLDAPGGLDLFLDLIDQSDTQTVAGAQRKIATARDKAWSELISLSGLPQVERDALHAARSEARRARKARKRTAPLPGAPARRRRPWVPIALAAGALGIGAWLWTRSPSPDAEPADPIVAAASEDTTSSPPEPPSPSGPRPDPAVADGQPGSGAPQPEPVTAAPRLEPTTPARPAPAPRPAQEPTPEPTPDPTPEPAPAPTPKAAVATSDPGCVVFQSFPPGADVTVNGTPSGLVALGGDSTRRSFPSGSLTVGMGSEGTTLATTTVTVTAGTRSVVRCDLIGAGGCTVRSTVGSCD